MSVIKYIIVKNYLKGAAGKYLARVEPELTLTLNDIVDRMVASGTTLTKTDIIAVLNSFFEIIIKMISQGFAINLGYFHIHYTIQGNFDSPTDQFDPTKGHRIVLHITPGVPFKQGLEHIRTERIHATPHAPLIEEVTDITSGKTDSTITPGGMVNVSGENLKVEGDDTSVGVYFVDSSKTEHKVTGGMADNIPSRLIFIVPALSAGTYTLEIRTQYSGGGTTVKKPRTGVYKHTLTVQ